jgi:hypothetical protein
LPERQASIDWPFDVLTILSNSSDGTCSILAPLQIPTQQVDDPCPVELGGPVLDHAFAVDAEVDDPGLLVLLTVDPANVTRRLAEFTDVLHHLVAVRQSLAPDQLAEIRPLVHHLAVLLAQGVFQLRVVDSRRDLMADPAAAGRELLPRTF